MGCHDFDSFCVGLNAAAISTSRGSCLPVCGQVEQNSGCPKERQLWGSKTGDLKGRPWGVIRMSGSGDKMQQTRMAADGPHFSLHAMTKRVPT